MTSQTLTQNVFAGAVALNSDDGLFLTKTEFQDTVAQLTQRQGKVTGSLVRKIREDWEALGDQQSHPATADAEQAYRSFVKRFGALELLDLLVQ